MGCTGARYVGMIRGVVGLFMFGVQTFFISKSLGYIARIILFKIDNQLLQNEIQKRIIGIFHSVRVDCLF